MMGKSPQIRHNDIKQEMRLFRRVLQTIVRQEEDVFRNLVVEGLEKKWGVKVGDRSEKALLAWRRALASYIKSGMLERKDQELEVIAIACMIYFCRMDAEDAARQEAEWL